MFVSFVLFLLLFFSLLPFSFAFLILNAHVLSVCYFVFAMCILSRLVPLWARAECKKALVCLFTTLGNKEFVLSCLVLSCLVLSLPPVPSPSHHRQTSRPFFSFPAHRLVGLVVTASASRTEGPGFESRLRRDFSGSSHTSDLKIGTPVATLPGAIGSGRSMSVFCDWVR